MIYEQKKGKGVRKGKLPPPKKVELPLNSTLQDLLLFGRNEFFNKINPLGAVSVYIRSLITSAYRGERIYTLAIKSATVHTLPI